MDQGQEAGQAKQRWETPRLIPLGKVADVVLGGGGKLSVTGGDPGDARKPNVAG